MNNGIHLIMPMGGAGTRFSDNGYELPKPLLEIHGKPFFWWATQSIAKYTKLRSLIFVVLKDHVERFGIDEKISKLFPKAQIVVIPHVLNGAVLTCLEGVKAVDDNAPVVFNDCDHMFRCTAFEQFCMAGDFTTPDGALLTFESDNPKFSFAVFDADGKVSRTVEKQAVSSDAICGAYYFRNREIFESAVLEYLHNCSYKEYFVSGVYNVMCAKGLEARAFRVDWHVPFGTPDEFIQAQKEEAAFQLLRE